MRVRSLIVLLAVLGTHVTSVVAGICASGLCCIDDQSSEAQEIPAGPAYLQQECLGRPPEGGRWACEDPSLDFPTVECITADIKLCGIIGANGAQTVFYSFGLKSEKVRPYSDKLTPPGNLYNVLLDTKYWKDVMTGREKTFRLNEQRARTFVLIARSAEAMGVAASGEVLVYIPSRNGKGRPGAFQDPLPKDKPDDGPNIWLTYELPALQRNPQVKRIVSIDIKNNLERTVEWEDQSPPPGLDNPLLPEGQANALPVPDPIAVTSGNVGQIIGLCPIPKLEADAPADPPATTDTATATATTAATITSPAATKGPSCVLHNQDPDQGITKAFCLCDGSSTFPPLSVAQTGHQSDSCAYTALPATATEVITTLASTFTQDCQACTQIALNAPSCQSIPQCTPTKAIVTVQAGSSPVHVGTLTGTALYTSVSSALEKLCPTVSQTDKSTACTTDSVSVGKIDFVSDNNLLHDGSLVIKVAASSYNTTALRDAMIKSAALTAQKGSENPSSCYNASFDTIVKREDYQPSRIFGRRGELFDLYARDRPHPVEDTSVLCNTAAFAGVQYFSAEWRQAAKPGAEAFIDATWEFKTPPGGNFICDFIEELTTALVAVAPEFAPLEAEEIPEIRAACDDALGDGN